jgi:flavin reductase (DIM6/NTAB) family NADH-FMN oxidoreductase RutF
MAQPAASRTPIEHGDPTFDTKAFRRSLGQYPTGVTVVAARHGEKMVGMAVNSFAAVSLAPPMVLWSIRHASRSAPAFLQAGHFAVSILAEHQVAVAQAFGSGLPDSFDRFAWHAGLGGAPLIEGAIAHLECSTEAAHEGGDHHVLLGRVLRHTRFEGTPLVFAQGQYAVTQNHPHLASPAQEAGTLADPGPAAPPSFLRLLSVASQRLSGAFQVHRDALDLTPAMARILSALSESERTLDELEHATYLGHLSLEDALAQLSGQGLAACAPDGRHALTPQGRGKHEALARRSGSFLQEKLQGVAPADIEAAWRVMSVLQNR